MKTGVLSFIAGTLLLSPAAMAQQQYPYSCTWTSQVAPAATIQFTSTNGIGGYQGAVYLNGRWIMNFREGNYQGYASNWWHRGKEGQDKPGRGTIVVFKHDVPVRSLAGARRDAAATTLLTVGLGSTLYYGDHRGNGPLIRAAEGFWIPGKGCRHLNGRV